DTQPPRPVQEGVNPTDTSDPAYFHRVVDCQWACPAHTNVPEYIRLIAQGRYTESYMLNRESNVFPAILGRTCDRPCEPACRPGLADRGQRPHAARLPGGDVRAAREAGRPDAHQHPLVPPSGGGARR